MARKNREVNETTEFKYKVAKLVKKIDDIITEGREDGYVVVYALTVLLKIILRNTEPTLRKSLLAEIKTSLDEDLRELNESEKNGLVVSEK